MAQEVEAAKRPLPVYLSPALRERIEAAAKADKRRLSPQIEVLLEEALDARERMAG